MGPQSASGHGGGRMTRRRGLSFSLPLTAVTAGLIGGALLLSQCSSLDRGQVSAEDPEFAHADIEQAAQAGGR